MSRFRFAHIADAHVGAWSKDEELRTRLLDSVLKALEVVERERCDFLLIAGDMFHVASPPPEEVLPVARALHRLQDAGIRIYAVFGSHDFTQHHTSWLDVLSASGLFIRLAPQPVLVEGVRWDLPWVRDEGTGAVIAGISGRAKGLDKNIYGSMNSEAFLAAEGFHIFVFHSGVLEYLPSSLREMMDGVPVDVLPAGCGYFAGGHIHATYSGPGPGGKGIVVNPGAVFGTSSTDLEAIDSGETQAGVVIVDVDGERATPRWVPTTEKGVTRVVDVDVTGCDDVAAVQHLVKAVGKKSVAGTLLIPRLRGTPSQQLDLARFATEAKSLGANSVHLDVEALSPVIQRNDTTVATTPEGIEAELLGKGLSGLTAPQGEGSDILPVALQLLKELSVPRAEGEQKSDYTRRMVRTGLRILGWEDTEGGPT